MKMRTAKCSLGESAGMGVLTGETGNPVMGGLRNLVPFEEDTEVDNNNKEGKVEAMDLVVSFISS